MNKKKKKIRKFSKGKIAQNGDQRKAQNIINKLMSWRVKDLGLRKSNKE